MEDIVSLLEEFLSKDTKYHTKEDIQKSLKLKGEVQVSILEDALTILEENGKIFFDKKYGYRVFPTKEGFAFGEIQINKSGTGFVHTNDGYTILIENIDLNGSLDGDSVIVTNIYSKRKDYFHGEVYKVTKRKTGNVILQVVGNGLNASLIPYNNLEYVNIDINPNEIKNLIDGDIILVKVGTKQINGVFKGTIEKVIGNKDYPDTDVKVILEKYGIPIDFSKQAIEESKSIPKEVAEFDLKNRIDLRNENIITIDCDTTKDRDDAVSIKKLDNGNYILKVHIAHVSHYVKEDSAIFNDALNRCLSHYPLNFCVPMLLQNISNGICSLNPNQDRLTRTVEMEINNEGEIVNYNIYRSIINSKKAMSYSEVNKVLNGEYLSDYESFKPDLYLFKELNKILQKARKTRNYIDFNTHKPKEQYNKYNEVVDFKPENLGLAGQIIENCMLVANTTIYRHFAWFVLAYRVHEAPNELKVKEVINILRESGINVPKIKNADSRSLKTLIDNLNNDEVSEIVREFLLKAMKKAKYDINNIGHFALQYDVYGHFTSPIRRIIDLITHMTIDKIEDMDYSKESVIEFEKFLKEVCDKANKIEKVSMLIEDEALEMRMAEVMEKHIGEKFEVLVTDINSHSLIVRTKNLIRGKLKLSDMQDDKYHFDFDRKAIIGKKSKKKYQIGNKMLVLVKDASKESRTVYFEIPKQKVLKIS